MSFFARSPGLPIPPRLIRPRPTRFGKALSPLMWLLAFTLGAGLGFPLTAFGQGDTGLDPRGRPIASVELEGLVRLDPQAVFNSIRSTAGDPYDDVVVQNDIDRLTLLDRFDFVGARVQPNDDGSVSLTFVLNELPLLADVVVAGNRNISDGELLALVRLRSGDPARGTFIEQGRRRIIAEYERQGYFVVDVSIDQELLDETGILVFSIREGPRVRIKGIRFEGNTVFADRQLLAEIRTRTHIPIFRKSALSLDRLELDDAAIRNYYRGQGYLEARVGSLPQLSEDQEQAVVTFYVEEGPRFLVSNIRVQGSTLLPDRQVLLNMALRPGDIYSEERLEESTSAIRDLYGRLGYLETRVQIRELYHETQPRVDLEVTIAEGVRSRVGRIEIRGNNLTRDRVILREIRGMSPGRYFNGPGVEQTRRRLSESSLFGDATVTVLGNPDDEVRDVLIQVSETNTGSLSFGAAISSDSGVLGAIDLRQSNFDITDWPDTASEFFGQRAFRGAGQTYNLTLQPGAELSRYSINFREPRLLDSNISLSTGAFFFEREREDFDEQRLGANIGVGRRFGDVWSGNIEARVESIDLQNIEDDAPVDVFEVQGDNLLTAIGIAARRNTTDSFLFPTRGSRSEFGIERVGAFGGDFNFTRVRAEFSKFWLIEEDYLGRPSVLRFSAETGYILERDEAPLFERFYAGGHSSFRGFDFRGVGPRGIQNDTGMLGNDPVGGDFMFLTTLEYSVPLYQDFLRGVVFTDMGTVETDIGFDDWRVSLGVGIRVKVPFLGQAPLALDFAEALISEDGDETRQISFAIELPF